VHVLTLSKWSTQHQILKSNNILLRAKDVEGMTPPQMSCRNNTSHLTTHHRIQTLLTAGWNKLALARASNGATALHFAAGEASATLIILRALYETGNVAIHACSKQGGTPLHWAAGITESKDNTQIARVVSCRAIPAQSKKTPECSSSIHSTTLNNRSTVKSTGNIRPSCTFFENGKLRSV